MSRGNKVTPPSHQSDRATINATAAARTIKTIGATTYAQRAALHPTASIGAAVDDGPTIRKDKRHPPKASAKLRGMPRATGIELRTLEIIIEKFSGALRTPSPTWFGPLSISVTRNQPLEFV